MKGKMHVRKKHTRDPQIPERTEQEITKEKQTEKRA